jgi:hypothetical protein
MARFTIPTAMLNPFGFLDGNGLVEYGETAARWFEGVDQSQQ